MNKRYFDKEFNTQDELMEYLDKLNNNTRLVSVYTLGSIIEAIFEKTNEKSHVHDYVVVNYNQKPENTITHTTPPPFYCGGCTTMFND